MTVFICINRNKDADTLNWRVMLYSITSKNG